MIDMAGQIPAPEISFRIPLHQAIENVLTYSNCAFDPENVKAKMDERRADGKETPIEDVSRALEELLRRGAITIRWHNGKPLYQGPVPYIRYPH